MSRKKEFFATIKVPKIGKYMTLLEDETASNAKSASSSNLKFSKAYISPLSWKKSNQGKDSKGLSRSVDSTKKSLVSQVGNSLICSDTGANSATITEAKCEAAPSAENSSSTRNVINKENEKTIDLCDSINESGGGVLNTAEGFESFRTLVACEASTPIVPRNPKGQKVVKKGRGNGKVAKTCGTPTSVTMPPSRVIVRARGTCRFEVDKNGVAYKAISIELRPKTDISPSKADRNGIRKIFLKQRIPTQPTTDKIIDLDSNKVEKPIEVVDLSSTLGVTGNQFGSDCASGQNDVIVLDDEEFRAPQLYGTDEVSIVKVVTKYDKKIDIIDLDDTSSQPDDYVPLSESATEKAAGSSFTTGLSASYLLSLKRKRGMMKAANKSKMLLKKAKKVSVNKSIREHAGAGTSKKRRKSKVIRIHNSLANYPRPTKMTSTSTSACAANTSEENRRPHRAENRKTRSQSSLKIAPNIYGNNFENPMGDSPQQGLRPIVIDGSNVAMGHGKSQNVFSCKGLNICVQYFLKKGHKVHCLVPLFRRSNPNTRDGHILEDLENEGHLSFTPSRYIEGRTVTPYDDRFIVQTAATLGGVIVSRDNYQDLLLENPHFKEAIQQRLLMFTWVGDILMFPQDPLGRHGPNLDDFLRF